jgi:site-specific DNA-methyltransferase (adenine-specific)
MKGHVEEYLVKDGQGWRTNYYGNVLTGSGLRSGESGKAWRGFDPSAKKRHWAIPKKVLDEIDEDLSGLGQHEKLDRLFELGYIKIISGRAWPIYEHHVNPAEGQAVPDIWAYQPYTGGTVFGTDDGIDEDVRWLSPKDQERLGYQTQKPEGILERIIKASSKEGDTVLDPFCGCGTTIAVCQKLERRWIGIDITQPALVVIKKRLEDTFGEKVSRSYKVVGEPTCLSDAEILAAQDPYQFQWWALGLVGARPTEEKKGPDRGIDGRHYFHDDPKTRKTKQIIFSVKAGKVTVSHVRDLRGVVEREKAEMGALISMRQPTKEMRREAAGAGFYKSAFGKHPKIQILTIANLLNGKKLDSPPAKTDLTFKRARVAKAKPATTPSLLPEPE